MSHLHDQDDDDANDNRQTPIYPLQTQFWKSFGRQGIFLGTVTSYKPTPTKTPPTDPKNGAPVLYHCQYVDGDSEDLSEDELTGWLKRYRSRDRSASTTTTASAGSRRAGRRGSRSTTTTKTTTTTSVENESKRRRRRGSRGGGKSSVSGTENEQQEASGLSDSKPSSPKENPQEEKDGHDDDDDDDDDNNDDDNVNPEQKEEQEQEQDSQQQQQQQQQQQLDPQEKKDSHDDDPKQQEEPEEEAEELTKPEEAESNVDVKQEGTNEEETEEAQDESKVEKEETKSQETVLQETGEPEEEMKVETAETQVEETDPASRTWEESFQILRDYKAKHQTTNVPFGNPDDPALGAWVDQQRTEWKEGRIDPVHFQQLDALYFVWDPPRSFDDYWGALQDYRDRFGDTNVPRYWKEDTGLGRWVARQRQRRREKTLTTSEVRKLNRLKFDFVDPTRKRPFSKLVEVLTEFKQINGHVHVPDHYPDDPKLAKWVARVRSGDIALSDRRRQQLDDLGFLWTMPTWREHYKKLERYRKRHGHCNVPVDYKKYPALGAWVQAQRHHYDRLSEDRQEKLEQVGFMLDPNETSNRRKSRSGRSNLSRKSSARNTRETGSDSDESEDESRELRSEGSSLDGSVQNAPTARMNVETYQRRRSSASMMNSPGAKKRRRVLTTHGRL